MNKLLTVGTLSACLTLTMPVATWANENIKTVETAQFESTLPYVTDMTPKYTRGGVNIRKEPNTNSEIYGQTILNGTVDVILEIDGWSMIFAEDCENNHAFIKSEYLSDVEITYSEDDLYTLAKTACGEAQYCPDEEQRLVLSVVENRRKHKDYPNTFKGVVKDKRWGIQYLSWYDGNAEREIQQSNWDNARYILENGSILPEYVIGQSQSVPKGKTLYLQTKYHCYWY